MQIQVLKKNLPKKGEADRKRGGMRTKGMNQSIRRLQRNK